MNLPDCTSVFAHPLHQPSQLLRSVRLGSILCVWLLLLLFLQRRYRVLSCFFAEKSSSVNLGVARIATMLTLLWQVRHSHIARMAALDHALLVPFLGWGKLALRLPLSHIAVTSVTVIFVIFTCCALVGIWTRPSCAVSSLSSLYLLCIPQLTGKVDHDYGHLVIFAFILALAPSGDSLSLQAFLLGRRSGDPTLWLRPRFARIYATALQGMMLYLGLAYFFPGIWKLVGYGVDWFRPSHLHFAIVEMWDGVGMTHFQLWVLSHPTWLFVGAATTIVFELGCLLVLLSPRIRPFIIPVGLFFHNLTFALMGIAFAAVQASYVIFFDWSPLFARLADRYSAGATATHPPEPSLSSRASPALSLFCLAALAGVVLTGALRKMTTWPINCYPTFDWPQSPYLEVRTLQAVDIYGARHAWTLSFDREMSRQFGNERWKAMTWYDFGADAGNHARNRAAIRLWLASHPSPPLTGGVVWVSVLERNPLLPNPLPGDLHVAATCPVVTLTAADLP